MDLPRGSWTSAEGAGCLSGARASDEPTATEARSELKESNSLGL